MKKLAYILPLIVLLFTSCKDYEATIIIKNEVHNVQLTSLKFGDNYLSGYLIPGETSTTTIIVSDKDEFPMNHPIEFYMNANGNSVFLKTTESFTLNEEQVLTITISDSTEVINPMLRSTELVNDIKKRAVSPFQKLN